MNPSALLSRVLQQQRSTAAAGPRGSSSRLAAAAQSDAATGSAPPTVDEEMRPLNACLTALQQSHATAEFREDQLSSLFGHLRHASAAAQIQALDRLAAIIQEKPAVVIGCNNIIALIVRAGAGAAEQCHCQCVCVWALATDCFLSLALSARCAIARSASSTRLTLATITT